MSRNAHVRPHTACGLPPACAQVRLYKKQEHIDKCYNGVPNVPNHFTGRDEIIEDLIAKVEGDVRVIQLQVGAGRGEGKAVLAWSWASSCC